MKKWMAAALCAAMLCGSAAAAEPSTLTDKADRLDEVVYGSVQSGSFLERVGSMDELVYGSKNTSSGLDDRVSGLYKDVISGDGTQASISTRVNTLEYYLTDEIKQDSLQSRVETLESTVFGVGKTGAMDARTAELEKAVYGDTHFDLVKVTLPANTVFKISLNEDISSKTNEVGDEVNFTVAEDVLVDEVLVLPRGAQGSGVVTKVSRPKMFGRSGSLDIAFNQVFTIDGAEIPTVLGPEAKEKLKMQAAAVGASVVGALALGPIGLVGGLFVKGKDVEIPAGSELYIQTQEDVETRGVKQVSGAPSYTLRKRTSNTVKDENVTTTLSDKVEKSAVADDVAEIEETAEETGSTLSEKVESAKEQAEEKVKESAGAAAEDEEASVIIVRNE